MIELDEHPFFVASQFHPEFKSRPERPAPLFRDFVAAALERSGEPARSSTTSPRAGDVGRTLARRPPAPAQRASLS